MKLPKIYRRVENPNEYITKTTITVDKLQPIDYVPDVDFEDDKSITKYVRTIKSAVRGSIEYKNLIRFLKDKLNMNKCFFYPKIKKERDTDVAIEIHHTCLVMEDIVLTVLRKRYIEGETYDVQSVAEEIMREHYLGDISLTALSSTAHSLIHEESSTLFIPVQMCDFGNISKFVEKYEKYMKKELLEKYHQYLELSNAVSKIDDIIPDYMDRHYIYYKCEGVEIPSMDKISEILAK